MKKIVTIICMMLTIAAFAQTPEAINYQAVARDAGGNLLSNQLVSFQLSILQGSPSGTAVYVESHQKTTNQFGLTTLEIGRGTVVSGNFSTIAWENDNYYLQTEMDPTGGTSYSLMGTSQFLSVPYALHSKNGVSNGQNPGDMLYWNGTNWVGVPTGSNGQVLTLNNGIPTWGGTQLPTISTKVVTAIHTTNATCGGNIIYDGGTAVTARGVCWSTSANPTISDSHTIDGTGTSVFVSILTGLTLNTLYYVRAYATNSIGTVYGNEVSFTTHASWLCGDPIIINHVAGAVAPVDKSVTYGTVTNIPGEPSKCWITRNLGASQQATAVSDATELSAGWYWQFNRKQGYKHDGTTLTPSWTITSINENSDWTTANDPCTIELGSGWRIPTNTEWTNVDASGNWTDWNGPWSSGLKLHAAGNLNYYDGSLYDHGSYGYDWSSTQNDAAYGWSLYLDGDNSDMSSLNKAYGFSLRCLINCISPPSAPTSGVHTPSETQIIWNWNTVSDATGYKWNTTNDYGSAEDMGMSTTKTETSLTCNKEYTRYVWAYNSCGISTQATLSQTTAACSWVCGNSFTVNHVAGTVAPVDKTVSYGTVTNIPGETSKCWITRNLGASQQATDVYDATEASAGWYWQFNRKQGYKHDGTTRTPNTTWISSISESSDWTAANDPCTIELGSGWRIPTNTEWTNVDASGNWNDWNGTWNSGLKLHAAGLLYDSDGSLYARGSYGTYWSSTQLDAAGGRGLYFSSSDSGMGSDYKAYGFTLRCIRE